MKYLKTYNQLKEEINIRDMMTSKSDEEILDALSHMSTGDRMNKVKSDNLGDKFMPSDDEIKEYLDNLNFEDKIYIINKYKLDDKFMPSDDEIKEYLNDFDIENKIYNINKYNLDDKFMPSDDEIKEYLNDFDIEDWVNMVYELQLDRSKFNPPQEKILEYILPINIKYNKENNTLEFSEWSDFADIFEENSDIRDDYVEGVLSGMGLEYFEIYELQDPDYFTLKEENLKKVKSEIKEKIDELDLTDEDYYDNMIEEFNSSDSFDKMFSVLNEYDMDDIVNAIKEAYTRSQELADESEAYNSLIKSIQNTFECDGEITYDPDKERYIMPCSIPYFNADEIIDKRNRIIEWSVPYYGWNGYIDEDTFIEELNNKLYDI